MPNRPPSVKRAKMRAAFPTDQSVRDAITGLAKRADEYAGIPHKPRDVSMVIHPSYRFAPVLGAKPQKTQEWPKGRNAWMHPSGYLVYVVQDRDGKVRHEKGVPPSKAQMNFRTIEVATSWTVAAENAAVMKLRTLIRPHLVDMYLLSGMFLETSARSKLCYVFRKLRPTIVLHTDKLGQINILTTLCLHPIGYYTDSWAGAMVPTDEVIAHLMLMRGDEADYWRQANQHPAHTTQSGL